MAAHGEAIGAYAAALLDTPLPWTKMRSVYRLFGLVRKWGADRVEEPCARALDAEAIDVGLVSRMLERAAERAPAQPARPAGTVLPGRFARDAGSPSTRRGGRVSTASAPTVTPELRQLLRRLKLGKTLDTLPERLALARSQKLGHGAFLELVLADEVERRDRTGTARRAAVARLDASMTLQTWDDDTTVAYDRALWADRTTLDFVEHHHGAFILGPVGVGKTHPLTPSVTSPAAGGCACTPTVPTDCSNGSKPLVSTPAKTKRCVGSSPWICSSSTTSPSRRWTPSRPPTSTRSASSGTCPAAPC